MTEQDSLMVKTFVFEDEITSRSENLEISLRADVDTIDINYIVNIWRHKNEITQNVELKIYDPQINRYVTLSPETTLKKGYLYSSIIMIKYKYSKTLVQKEDDVESLPSSKASSQSKRERNRERTIREVLEYVKQWREIHKTLDQHKNKINLQDAAKIVGISKKSLDDYYCQLRLAEQYGFDFQLNIQQKIGVLRTFVKQQRPKETQGIKHERLPKKLRVLENLGKEFKVKRIVAEEIKMEEQPPVESIIEAQYEPPLPVIPEDQYENRFYNSFDFMLDEPEDPFIMIGKTDLQKEQPNSDSEYSYL